MCLLCFSGTLLHADAKIDFFESKIRPVLVKQCYSCHSLDAKKSQGGLLLDSKQAMQRGGESGPAIVPHKIDESLLIDAIRYEGLEMPPKKRLSKEVVNDFVKWVEMGAPDPREEKSPPVKKSEIDFEAGRQFWSFQPVQRPVIPKVKQTSWPHSDLDRFILAKLEAKGMQPVSDADRTTLLRRVTFDLTGLPPTPVEIEAYLEDRSENAFEKVVDRLLKSSHFGEHWGRHWLDLSRYADSNGGDINLTYPNAWRFRDYVVKSMNIDKRFDQFIREQIAGDLLPASNAAQQAEQMTASGFLILGPKMLSERDKVKLRMDVVDEQLDSCGRVFLGMTLGCARCHDHKFDPVSTRDYYAMAGILRNSITIEGIRMGNVNVSGWIERSLPIEAKHQKELDEYNKQLSMWQTELKSAKNVLARLEEKSKLPQEKLLGIVVDDEQAEKVGTWKFSTFVPRYVGKGYIHDEKLGKGEKTLTYRPNLPTKGTYEVRFSYASGNGRAKKVPIQIHHAKGDKQLHLNQLDRPELSGLFTSLGQFEFEKGTDGFVKISTTGTVDYVIADAVQFIPVEALSPKSSSKNQKDAKLKDAAVAMQAKVSAQAKQVKELEQKIAALKKNAPAPAPKVMVSEDRPEIEDCKICIRGEPHNTGDLIPRGFLTVLRTGDEPDMPANQSGRIQLAEWMANEQNPSHFSSDCQSNLASSSGKGNCSISR